MIRIVRAAVAVTLASVAACGTAPARDDVGSAPSAAKHAAVLALPGAPAGRGMSPDHTCPAQPIPGLMGSFGAPVMAGTINVYFIWYGQWPPVDWTWSPQQTILTDFVSNIGGSPYFALNQLYGVSGAVSFGGSTTDRYSRGATLQAGDTGKIVAQAITSGSLPSDPNGVYFVLGAKGVEEASTNGTFCYSYCGYHDSTNVAGVDIKYAFVGNPETCPQASCEDPCVAGPPPNGYKDADSMVTAVAHELEEAATDPDSHSWLDSSSHENADKCAYVYGPTFTTPSGAQANVNLGGKSYLVQQYWVNEGPGYCSTRAPSAPTCTVYQACGAGGVTVTCDPAAGDVTFERIDGSGTRTIGAAPASTALFQSTSATDKLSGSGTIQYRACVTTPSGSYCGATMDVSFPASKCHVCLKGQIDCGDYCARPGQTCN